jgi:hypothetical protein
MVSLVEADTTMRVKMRLGLALRVKTVANASENYVAQCDRCNFGQGERSFTPAAVMAAYLLARPEVRPLNPDSCLTVLDWCKTAESWRPA